MGEKNDAFCTFMEKEDVFADFINGTVFGGRREVAPEELETVPGIYHAKKKNGRKGGTRGRYRDVAKKRFREGTCCVLTVENQSELHYAMPARCKRVAITPWRGLQPAMKCEIELAVGSTASLLAYFTTTFFPLWM